MECIKQANQSFVVNLIDSLPIQTFLSSLLLFFSCWQYYLQLVAFIQTIWYIENELVIKPSLVGPIIKMNDNSEVGQAPNISFDCCLSLMLNALIKA